MTLDFPHHAINPTVDELGWMLWIIRTTRRDEFYTPPGHPSLEFVPADEEYHDPADGPFDKYDCAFDNCRGKRLTHNQRLAYARALWAEFNTCERIVVYFELHSRFHYQAKNVLHGEAFRDFAGYSYASTQDSERAGRLRTWMEQTRATRLSYMRACHELLVQLLEAHDHRELPDETYAHYQQRLADHRRWAAAPADDAQVIEEVTASVEAQFRHLDLGMK